MPCESFYVGVWKKSYFLSFCMEQILCHLQFVAQTYPYIQPNPPLPTPIFHLLLHNHHLPKQFSPICIVPTSVKQPAITNLRIESYRPLLRFLTYSVLVHPIGDRKCLFFVVFAYTPHSLISIEYLIHRIKKMYRLKHDKPSRNIFCSRKYNSQL